MSQSPPPTGTIDLTNVVNAIGSTFVTFGTQFILTSLIAVPALAWLNLPVIRPIFSWLLTKLLTVLSNAAEMQAFFINTAIRKSGQANDFIDAIAEKQALPPTATQAQILAAEQKQMAAFRNFVMVSN